jgi:DNA-directed RNA polymerase subunit M/transcription elongation factor TFIIS
MLVVEDGVSYVPGGGTHGAVLCGATRARARDALHEALPKGLFTESERITYATHLEACASAFGNNDHNAYMTTMSRVVYNIRTNGEHIIRTYPISKVCRLSNKRLKANTARAERDHATENRLQALMSKVEVAAENASKTASSVQTDSKITCPKCRTANDITRVLAQVCRGDEGMTTWCHCKCGSTWKLAS